MSLLLTIVYLAACGAILVSVFCRLTQTTVDTHIEVRLAFVGLAAAAALGIFSVLAWGHVVALPEAALALAVAGTQAVAARLWRFGVPRSYQS